MDAGYIVAGIMLASGAGGGLANYFLNDDRIGFKEGNRPALTRLARMIKSIFIGAIAAFVVPLFLSLARSSLISDILSQKAADGAPDPHLNEMFILSGFCIVAALSSQTFMQGVTRQVMNFTRAVEEKAVAYVDQRVTSTENELRAEIEETKATTDTISEAFENSPDPEADAEVAEIEKSTQEQIDRLKELEGDVKATSTILGENIAPADGNYLAKVRPELSIGEHAVLKALWARRKLRRMPSSLAREVGLSRAAVQRILDRLIGKGLVEQSKHSRAGGSVYRLSSSGGVRTFVMFGNFPPSTSPSVTK